MKFSSLWLKVFVCLTSVIFVHNFEIKCRHAFNVYTLACAFNYIDDNRTIAADMPSDFRNLTENIVHLTLSISNLTTLPSDTFLLMPNLRILELRAGLHEMNSTHLKHASKLMFLDLGYSNQLKRIKTKLFAHTKAIEFIDLSFNQIETIESKAFYGIGRVLAIYLAGNLLTTIPNWSFVDAVNLRKLDLSRNQIEQIDDEAFSGLAHLRWLHLNQNRIKRLQKSLFSSLRLIERIDLSVNAIETIESGAFDELEHLEFLELAFNAIKTVSDGMFDGLGQLITLHISGNQIGTFNETFLALTKLKNLDASYNPIETFDAIILSDDTKLESLELRGCNISEIDEIFFVEQNELQLIDLSENNLTKIDLNSFDALDHLKFLKLESTGIGTIENITEINDTLPSLKFINLAGNTIDCTIVNDMIEAFNSSEIEYEFGERIDVGCNLLPFQSRALQAYELSKAKIIDGNKIDDEKRSESERDKSIERAKNFFHFWTRDRVRNKNDDDKKMKLTK